MMVTIKWIHKLQTLVYGDLVILMKFLSGHFRSHFPSILNAKNSLVLQPQGDTAVP